MSLEHKICRECGIRYLWSPGSHLYLCPSHTPETKAALAKSLSSLPPEPAGEIEAAIPKHVTDLFDTVKILDVDLVQHNPKGVLSLVRELSTLLRRALSERAHSGREDFIGLRGARDIAAARTESISRIGAKDNEGDGDVRS